MKTFSADVLVIGGGGAGLMSAVTARKMGKKVIVVSKFGPGVATCTTVSAAAFSNSGKGRSKEAHRRDTLQTGQGLNESTLIDHFIENAAEDIGSLIGMGVLIQETVPGYYGIYRSPFFRGPVLVNPLTKYAREIGVEFVQPYVIGDLIIRDNHVLGAWGFEQKTEEAAVFIAPSVILACGGGSALYSRNDNPASICGDGYAMGARVGLGLINMEFVQFYPLMTDYGEGRVDQFMLWHTMEASRFVNEKGEDLAEKYQIPRPLAIKSRDLTSRVMMLEKKTYLDFSETTGAKWEKVAKASDPESTLQIRKWVESHLSLKKSNKIPLSPTAHFCCGGIQINARTETQIEGLFAAGEVTGGVHGANRLGGNALSEAFVFGKQAGVAAAAFKQKLSSALTDSIQKEAEEKAGQVWEEASAADNPSIAIRKKLTSLMWEKVGVLRNKEDLSQALQAITGLSSLAVSRKDAGIAKALEVKNMLLTGEMICRSALFREESRGSHYRLDYPEKDDANWLYHTHIVLEEGGLRLQKIPVK